MCLTYSYVLQDYKNDLAVNLTKENVNRHEKGSCACLVIIKGAENLSSVTVCVVFVTSMEGWH
jgi:xanthine dehydrogenase iron-sulfur cluster and FAD-binding subunit A